jgi:hypothetical protein
MANEVTPAGVDLSNERRGQAITEYVSMAFAALTGGFSEVAMMPIRRLIERRLKELEETLLEEMRSGLIDESTIIEEDRLAAFVLRVRRAAMEGAAKNKIKIIARYFFRNAPSSNFSDGKMADFANITEQLTDDDMRCLAIMKHARDNGYFERTDVAEGDRLIVASADRRDLFPDQHAFEEAVFALGRFGLIYQGSSLDYMGNRITKRGFDYVDNLDVDCIEIAS